MYAFSIFAYATFNAYTAILNDILTLHNKVGSLINKCLTHLWDSDAVDVASLSISSSSAR